MRFGIKTVDDTSFPISNFSAEDADDLIGGFLGDYENLQSLTNAIEIIDSIIKGQRGNLSGASAHGLVVIEIGQSNSDFYLWDPRLPNEVADTPDLTIPTVDFRDILAEWKKFLEKSK